MSSFAYSVAIKLSVANLASQGVRILANDLLKAHGAATNLQSKLSALKMVAVGYGLDRAGSGILGFMGKAIDAGKELARQNALMVAAGYTQREIAESTSAAWKTTGDVITSTAADNLATLRELRSAFGAGEGMRHAYAMLPLVQRVSGVLSSLTGRQQDHVGFDLVKAIEFGTKGALTVQEMQRQGEMMTKALLAFGGTLTVADFHQTFKASKSAAAYMTDDFKYKVLPTIMQEMKSGNGGAQAAGTAIATLFGTIKGHAIMTRMIPAWVQSGLITSGGIKADAHHKGVSRIMPGGIAGENLFTQNPELWAQKYLLPARDRLMAKMHVDEMGAYYALTGNRNTAFMFQTLVNKSLQFKRDADLIDKAQGSYGAYQTLLKKDPAMAQRAMENQWQNVLAILGYQVLPKILPLMVKFANGLSKISTWMSEHPNVTSTIAFGLIGIGGALSLIGKAMMIAGVIKFLGLAPMIAGWFTSAGSALGLFWGIFRGIMGAVWQGILVGGRALIGDLMLVFTPVGLVLAGIAISALLVWNNWKEIKGALVKSWADIKDGVIKLFHGDIIGALGSFTAVFLRGWQTVFNTLIAGVNTVLPAAMQIGKTHFADDYDTWRNRSAAVPPPAGRQQQAPMAMYLDGRKVGRLLTDRQTRAANRPNTGPSGFDWSRATPSPALRRP